MKTMHIHIAHTKISLGQLRFAFRGSQRTIWHPWEIVLGGCKVTWIGCWGKVMPILLSKIWLNWTNAILCCAPQWVDSYQSLLFLFWFWGHTVFFIWHLSRDMWFPTMWSLLFSIETQMMFGQWLNIHRIFKRIANALIRLRICTGWSEALQIAHTTLLEIPCHGSCYMPKF